MAFETPQNSPTTPPLPTSAESEPKITGSLKHLTRDPYNLDDLLKEFNTPRQDFTPPEPETPQEAPPRSEPGNFYDPSSAGAFFTEPEARMTPEEAIKAGKTNAKFLDTAISFGLKMFARDESAADYKATPEEINEMADPLSEISEKYNFKISPEITLAFLVFTIYLPKYFIATEKRQKALEKRTDAIERKLKTFEIDEP